MCGLYGHASFRGQVDEDQANRRLRLLSHRGPDFLGSLARPGLFLGHARLSILDVSQAANQPFDDEEATLIYNGEVYNYLSLRKSLPEQTWTTHSDTEVVFQLLAKRGVEILPKFNGMFAFAFWNKRENSLLLARDRIGIKPLYFRLNTEGIEFASEIKAFETIPDHFGAIKEVLSRGNWGQSASPFPGVASLVPGHFLRVNLNTGESESHAFVTLSDLVTNEGRRVWAGVGEKKDQLHKQWEEVLQKNLLNSIDLHLQSDAPLGSLCSGGIDSSLISALALRHRKDIPLYHCGVKGGGGEEAYAEIVAKHLGVELIVESMAPETFWELVPEVTWHLDQPIYFANDVGLHLISRRARRDGIKVLLCGEGADEMFGGYSWHQDMYRLMQGQARLEKWGSTVAKAWKRLHALSVFAFGRPQYSLESMRRFAAFGLCYPAPGIDRIYQGHAFSTEDFAGWKRWDAALSAYADSPTITEGAVQALLMDNLGGHLRSLLHRTDRILMANSIEGRVPFLENAMLDFAVNLPLRAKLLRSEGKWLLRQLARKYLPQSIIDRPKMGFPIPWEKYLPDRPQILRNGFVAEWSGLNPEQLHAFYQGDPMLHFRLLAIEIWGRIFVQGEKPTSIKVI